VAGLNIERLIIGAMFLGSAQRACDGTVAYGKERKRFDKPVGSFQACRTAAPRWRPSWPSRRRWRVCNGMGGYGYVTEDGVEELVRSMLVGTIVGGTK
jgi:alkylation response protein AidB-like acyl-CoA dehydrogenase